MAHHLKRTAKLLSGSLLALLLAGLAGCAAMQDLASSAFERPKLTFQRVSLEGLDLEGATLAFEYLLENPNGVGLQLARLGYALDVEGARVVAGDLAKGLAIPARGAAPVAFPVRIRFKDVPGFVKLLTSARDEVGYRLSGNAGVDTPIGVVELPLSHTSTLGLPKLPSFSLEGVGVRSASLTELGIDVRLKVQNPNRFSIPQGSLTYGLTLGGTQVASGDAAALAAVPAASAATVSLPVKVSVLGAGRTIARIVNGGGELPVALSGKASLAGIEVPVELAGVVPATRK